MELITTKPKTQIDTNNDTNKLKEVIEVINEKKFIAEPTKITFTRFKNKSLNLLLEYFILNVSKSSFEGLKEIKLKKLYSLILKQTLSTYITETKVINGPTEPSSFNSLNTLIITLLIKVNKNQIATVTNLNNNIYIMNITDGNVITKLIGHTDTIYFLLMVKYNLIASSCTDGTMKIWDTKARNCLRTIAVYGSFLKCNFLLKRLNDHMVISLGNRSVILWNIDNGEGLYSYFVQEFEYTSPILLYNSDYVLLGEKQNIKVLDIKKRLYVKTLEFHSEHVSSIIKLKRNQNHLNLFASGSYDKRKLNN